MVQKHQELGNEKVHADPISNRYENSRTLGVAENQRSILGGVATGTEEGREEVIGTGIHVLRDVVLIAEIPESRILSKGSLVPN